MKLLAAISHHGLGHLAQAGPVLSRIHALTPELELTIWSGLSRDALAARIPFPFRHRAEAADVGLAMVDALAVDIPRSHSAYLGFHRDWTQRVARECEWLGEQEFAGVFADAAYLPLAAARQAGIPGIGLCSLNWFDIAGAYLTGLPGMSAILAEIGRAYQDARAFLRPAPSMPMAWLGNTLSIPPIAARGNRRRDELEACLGPRRDTRRILVGFGGIGYQGGLPSIPDITWLAPDDWTRPGRDDVVGFSALGSLPFIDLLASSDALLTKVGYGSFVEAAAHDIPLLYIDRPDWPETPYLAEWLGRMARGLPITEAMLREGRIEPCLERLWAMRTVPDMRADGADTAARRILELLV